MPGLPNIGSASHFTTGDKFAQTQAPNQWRLRCALLPQRCTGTFGPRAREMLYYEPPNYCPSSSSLLPPSHGVTCKGAGAVFVKDRKPKATACRGLRCDICMGLHRFIWTWILKALLVKQGKNLYASPISISMASYWFNFRWWSYRAQLSQYDYFKNNKHVQKGDCICLSSLKFKNSCTDAISGWGWRQPCEWKPKMYNRNQH